MRKLIFFLLLCITFSLCSCKRESTKLIQSKNFPIFVNSSVKEDSSVNLYEFNEQKDIFYINSIDAFNLLNVAYNKTRQSEFQTKFTSDSNLFVYSKADSSKVSFDPKNNNIIFFNYDKFWKPSYALEGEFIDSFPYLKNSSENNICLIGRTNNIMRIKNEETIIDLNKYNINLIVYKNNLYIPFQTFSDIFLSVIYYPLVKMGNKIYSSTLINNNSQLQTMFKNDKFEISDNLLKFNLNELKLYIDLICNLSPDKTKDYLHKSLSDLCETYNPSCSVYDFDLFLQEYLNTVINNGHSGLIDPSPMNNKTFEKKENDFTKSLLQKKEMILDTINHKEFKCYEEIDNTAFISFNEFTILKESIYNKEIEDFKEIENDSNLLMAYAYKEINRLNSPIENIVIDLSLNSGGESNSLIYLLGFILDKVHITFKNNISNSISISTYESDTNLDHVIDDKDKLFLNKNIYIISTNFSYSAANDFISIAKSNPNVYIIGENSGGGATNTLYNISSIGTNYKISGNIVLLDENLTIETPLENLGTADINLSYEQLFNRKELTELINTLPQFKQQ